MEIGLCKRSAFLVGLTFIVGMGMMVESAKAQLRAEIGNATVRFNPIRCVLSMTVLTDATENEYASLSRSCSATGLVTKAAASAKVVGKVLVRAKDTAQWTITVVGEDGTISYAQMSGMPPIKFYMKFERVGPGEVSVSAASAETLISKNKFVAFKKALGIPKTQELRTIRSPAIGRIMAKPPYQPFKKAGSIEVKLN